VCGKTVGMAIVRTGWTAAGNPVLQHEVVSHTAIPAPERDSRRARVRRAVER